MGFVKMVDKNIPTEPGQIQNFINDVRKDMVEGEEFTVTALREDEEGNNQEVKLMAKIIKVDQRKPLEIKFADDPTSTQIAIRNAWLKPQTN